MTIDRRRFIQNATMSSMAIVSGIHESFIAQPRPSSNILSHKAATPIPSNGQRTWQEAEIGLIYHFDISVAAHDFSQPNNTHKKIFDPQNYNPEKLNTDQWLGAAKAAGAKYAIFTGTHFNGFLQWQSNAYPYGLKQAKWKNGKGDVFGDFVESCRKVNILPGIYISTHRNAYWGLWDYFVDQGKGKGTQKQEEFNRVAEKMTEEICSNYGPLIQIWFDAGTKLPHEGGPDVLSVFDKYQPDSVFYHSSKRTQHRWIGNEDGHASYPCWATMPDSAILSHNSPLWKPILGSGDSNGKIWAPGMVDIPLRGEGKVHNWLWAPDQDNAAFSKDKLIEMYYNSVGRNSNFVLGEVVKPEGLVPESDIQRLREFGDEIRRRFARPLAQTNGSGKTLRLTFSENKMVNHVVIQEEISKGERIRKYQLDALVDGTWQHIATGESVGHKRIERFSEVKCRALRLIVNKHIAEPQIKKFSAYMI